MNKVKIRPERILLVVGILCLAAAAAYSGYQKYMERKNTAEIEELKTHIESTVEQVNGENKEYVSPYHAVFDMNQDMKAWLKIPGTEIDYPIMQTPEKEEHYMYKDFYGNDNKNGSLVLAAACDVEQPTVNLLIHGHNMKNGTMFGKLTDFDTKEYGDAHNDIVLYTPKEERHYEILGTFYTKILKEEEKGFRYYRFLSSTRSEDYEEFCRQVKAISAYDTGVTAEPGDELITLSTCAYQTKNGRFVVVGKRIK